MKRVLITGGTGFVGSCLTRHLLRQGHDLHLLVRPGHRTWRIEDLAGAVRVHACRLEDPAGLERTLREVSPEWIFHLAAYGAYPSQSGLQQMLQTNLIGLTHIVGAALKTGFEAFINAGSSSEYGFRDHAPGESELPEPNSDYACAKAAATTYCQYIARREGVNLQTLRLYSVYGPYEEPSRLIPRLILHGLEGRYPPLVDPAIERDFVYVEDVCRAFELCASSNGPERGAVYNLGTGRGITVGALVQAVRELLGIAAEPAWGGMPPREWDTNVWRADPRKIMRNLGWQPAHTLDQGLRETVAWLRDNPSMMAWYREHQESPPC